MEQLTQELEKGKVVVNFGFFVVVFRMGRRSMSYLLLRGRENKSLYKIHRHGLHPSETTAVVVHFSVREGLFGAIVVHTCRIVRTVLAQVYTDQSLDRAAVSNARLLEEKERLEKENQRLSAMYAEAVRAGGRLEGVGGAFGGAGAGAEGLRRLQLESVAKDEKLRQLEAENQGLKARIRKLASVS